MTNKLTKIMAVVIITLAVLLVAVTPVFATAGLSWDGIQVDTKTSDTSDTAADISGIILGVVQVIGIAVAVIMLIVLAIKYISAAPNDKAEIKKHAVVYVVGAVVLFAASGIIGIIKGFAANINNSTAAQGGAGQQNQAAQQNQAPVPTTT